MLTLLSALEALAWLAVVVFGLYWRARAKRLEDAIWWHRRVPASTRTTIDDEVLYRSLGDGKGVKP